MQSHTHILIEQSFVKQCFFLFFFFGCFSEKISRTLNTYVVPVIYVAKGVEKFLPPHSYVDVRDFKTPKHLADYLLYLDKNHKAYMSYFKWKPYWDVRGGFQFSRKIAGNFCKYLLENSKPKVVRNFTDWFFHNNGCKDPDFM